MEFWNSLLTEKSWKILQELNKKYRFIVIGGWAIYLWAKQQKSKDVDIVVEINELQKLKQENLIKNDRLKKYEIKLEEIDVDIYVEHFSELAIPVSDLKKYSSKVEGFSVVLPEALLILKQKAEIYREYSVKGEKDRIDIMSILLFTKFDFKRYQDVLTRHKLEHYLDRLIKLIREFSDYGRFGLTPREFKLRKKRIVEELKKV